VLDQLRSRAARCARCESAQWGNRDKHAVGRLGVVTKVVDGAAGWDTTQVGVGAPQSSLPRRAASLQ